MHEGGHGILENLHHDRHSHDPHHHGPAFGSLLRRYAKFFFPALLLASIILSAIPRFASIGKFELAILPMLVGGGYITWSTVVAVIETRKITAGTMVVLALVGTAYVGEYLAGAVVAFMMIAGEFLEDFTLEKTRNAVREIVKLVPATATVKAGDGTREVATGKVRVGDIVLVRPGGRIPVDGIIRKGQAAINEASITGESLPVDKTAGDKVFVGTLNENGALEIEAEKVGSDTTLGRIIAIIQEAQDNKGAIQKFADKFAGYFTPIILAICALVWLFTHDLFRVMSVLVIACPCALVLATPTAVVASVGNIARRGGIIKGGVTLEAAGRITAICLDKTGTVTEGKLQVTEVASFGRSTTGEILENAYIAEKNSQHPIGAAIVAYAQTQSVGAVPAADRFAMLHGRGVKVTCRGNAIEVSNSKALADKPKNDTPAVRGFIQAQEGMGRTVLLVIVNAEIIGGIAVADTIRQDAKAMVEQLKKSGINKIIMLTGDNEPTAKTIAAQAGITDFRANLLPEDKLAVIRELQAHGETVAMIGDGVNDAPALTLADVGIAMGVIGTDVAIESSDIALMTDNLAMVPEIVGISRKALGLIKQNIWVFAVGVNVVGISLASSGYLSPIAGAVVHNLASIMVVGNSARLLTYRYANS